MNFDRKSALIAAGAVALAYLLFSGKPADDAKTPSPPPSPVKPSPKPLDPPRPKPRPWDERPAAGRRLFGDFGKITVGGPVAPDGETEVQVDFPVAQRTKNVGGSDGAGLCVFSSIGHAARWQNEHVLFDFQKWMRQHPGGGYPSKVDQMMERLCKEKGVPKPDYINYEGGDLAVLRAALESGRMPSVTYNGRDPHYSGTIAHMVNIVYLDDQWAAVLDNNFVGDQELVWLSPDEFKQRYTGGGGGWAVILLANAPPPPPKE